jgi:hypothetical protein
MAEKRADVPMCHELERRHKAFDRVCCSAATLSGDRLVLIRGPALDIMNETAQRARLMAIEDVIAWCEGGYEGLDREKACAFGVFGLLREVPDSIRRKFLDEVAE